MSLSNQRNTDRLFIYALFGAALLTHFYLVTFNWNVGFMNGHEFRQTQTAIISYYIDKENNFSAHYSTPILGKPWEFPLEYPLYEWCVVLLSRATHCPHLQAARAISLASFYLSLPAVFILMGQAGLERTRRLVVLALLLATPVYLFYSRAFLIDAMAFMFSVWFLAAFIATMRSRRWSWLPVCAVCGTAAALIKSLVFFAWLFPAGLYGAYCVWRDISGKRGGAQIAKTTLWGLSTVIAPGLALGWWVTMTDAIKEKHASAFIFTSKNLSAGNYGSFTLSSRTSAETWRELFARWREAIAEPWIIAAIIAAGLIFFPRERLRVLGGVALFLAAQLSIPYAYSGQDYYFYICAAFLIFAFGFVVNGLLDSSLLRAPRYLLALLPFGVLLHAHHQTYFKHQSVQAPGGTGLAYLLRDKLPEQSIIIVAGADWSAMIPYYSQHRALMIRNGLEIDGPYLARAFGDLRDEDVGALVLLGETRRNSALVDRAATAFGIERSPAVAWEDKGTVYLKPAYRAQVHKWLGTGVKYDGIARVDQARAETGPAAEALPPKVMAEQFAMFAPLPVRVHLPYGYGTWDQDGQTVVMAHPGTEIWLQPRPGHRALELAYGIRDEAFLREGGKTNGVQFAVEVKSADGTYREAFSRILNPLVVPGDRGVQRSAVELHLSPGEEIVLRTRPYGDSAFDWAYWAKVNLR